MATSLMTEIPTFVYSSHLREIILTTDLDKLIVALADGEMEVYRTTLYPFDGIVSVYDLRNVVELYMLDNDTSFTAFTFYYYDAAGKELGSFNLNTVYCTYMMPGVDAGILASSRFLSTITSKRTYPHSTEFLTVMHGQERNEMKAHCVFIDGDGEAESMIVTLSDLGYDNLGIDTVQVNYDEVLQKLTERGCVVNKLLAYTVSWGNRSFSFYVHSYNPDITFTFRNCFNVLESVSLLAVTTAKTKVERSVAVARSLCSFYDQTTTKEYEVISSPLSMAEAQWIEQLFMSHSVRLGVAPDVTSLPLVLITDNSCEITDSNTEPNRIKFNWQFKDLTPRNLNVAAISSERIHQGQFTLQYT